MATKKTRYLIATSTGEMISAPIHNRPLAERDYQKIVRSNGWPDKKWCLFKLTIQNEKEWEIEELSSNGTTGEVCKRIVLISFPNLRHTQLTMPV